jgi:hypothetical protein
MLKIKEFSSCMFFSTKKILRFLSIIFIYFCIQKIASNKKIHTISYLTRRYTSVGSQTTITIMHTLDLLTVS